MPLGGQGVPGECSQGGALPVRRGHASVWAPPLAPAPQRPPGALDEASARVSSPEAHGTSRR